VYYILSDGVVGVIKKNTINGNKLFNYNSSQFNEIYTDVSLSNDSSILVSLSNNSLLNFKNPLNSSPISGAESVDQIKENAPFLISSQLRLVTENDYEKFLLKSIPNLLNSVFVVDNKKFINEYIKYFYDICIDPNKVNRVILNQVNFADSCDFNNVNIFVVPFFNVEEDGGYPDFLSESFKNLIYDITEDKRMIGHEIVPRDPVYMAYDVGYSKDNISTSILPDCKLQIIRDSNNRISRDKIKKNASDVIKSFFASSSNKLGQDVDISTLNDSLVSIEGVREVRTLNKSEGSTYNGISFISWNPLYLGSDDSLVTQRNNLPFFKFPYLYNPNSLINKIEILDEQ